MYNLEIKDIVIDQKDNYICAVKVNLEGIPDFHVNTIFTWELWKWGTWANGLNDEEKESFLKKIAKENAEEYIKDGKEGPSEGFNYILSDDMNILQLIKK